MEIEIRLPVGDLGRLTSVLMENGFENLFVRRVPLSRGIEWTDVNALAESQRNVNVLVRNHTNAFSLSALPDEQNQVMPEYSKPAIEDVTTPDVNKENSTPAIMPPASLVYDMFGSPETKVGADQMRALLTQPINLNATNLSNSFNNINNSFRQSRPRAAAKPRKSLPVRIKKICNICGTVKTSVDEQIKHCMLHYNIKRYKCSSCGIPRKTLNFKIHFEKVCQDGAVVDLVAHDRAAMLQKVSEMFTVKK